jgi:hypothetical protein
MLSPDSFDLLTSIREPRPFNGECWENQISCGEKMDWGPYLTPHTKINSQWIKYLNARATTIKFFKKNRP